METFEVSVQRLRQNRVAACQLMELIAFLSYADDSLDFWKSLSIERPWLEELGVRLPNLDVFAADMDDQREYLAELENVSIGLRPYSRSPLKLHLLWKKCILQRAGHEGRVRWIGQILQLCYSSFVRGEAVEALRPFIKNCVVTAERFLINLKDIVGSDVIQVLGLTDAESQTIKTFSKLPPCASQPGYTYS